MRLKVRVSAKFFWETIEGVAETAAAYLHAAIYHSAPFFEDVALYVFSLIELDDLR